MVILEQYLPICKKKTITFVIYVVIQLEIFYDIGYLTLNTCVKYLQEMINFWTKFFMAGCVVGPTREKPKINTKLYWSHFHRGVHIPYFI